MTKYATIDMNSGYVWWAGEAMHPVEACKNSDLEGNNEAREFEEITRSQREHAAYAVYQIPADLSIDDGQDKEQIAAVEASRFVCYCAAL